MRSHRRMPALLTRMSSAPVLVDHSRDQRGPLLGIGHVVLDERAPDLGRGLRALVGEHVGDEDRRTLLGEQPRLRPRPDPRATGDDRHPCRRASPSSSPTARPVRGATVTRMGTRARMARPTAVLLDVGWRVPPPRARAHRWARSPAPSTRSPTAMLDDAHYAGRGAVRRSTVDVEADWAGVLAGVPRGLRRLLRRAGRTCARRSTGTSTASSPTPRSGTARSPGAATASPRWPRPACASASCRTPTG